MPRIRFDAFEFDPASRELFHHGSRVNVALKPLQLLDVLLQHPGELVTREALRHELWPADTFVDFDNNLNAAVRKLRDALGDSAEQPAFIETLPRRGYRFIGTINARRPPVVPEHAVAGSWPRPAGLIVTVAVAAAVLAAAVSWFSPSPRVVAVSAFSNVSGDATQQTIGEGLSMELAARLAITGNDAVRVALPRSIPQAVAASGEFDYLIEGSTHRDDSGLYVTARLIDANRRLVWAGTFMCPMGDTARIRRQLADKIAAALVQELPGA